MITPPFFCFVLFLKVVGRVVCVPISTYPVVVREKTFSLYLLIHKASPYFVFTLYFFVLPKNVIFLLFFFESPPEKE